MSSILSLNHKAVIDMNVYVSYAPTGVVHDKLLMCCWFFTRYRDVNLRRLTKPNRVACNFTPKSLPIFSTSRPPNQLLPVLPRGISNFLTSIIPCF